MKCDFSTHNFTESMFTPEKANFFSDFVFS